MRNKFGIYAACFLLGIISIGIEAQDVTNYVSSLDNEASHLELDHEKKNENNSVDIKMHDEEEVSSEKLHNASHNALIEGMTMSQFQSTSQENFMGSYSYFKRLSKKGRQAVYQAYLKSSELHEIRESII